MKLLFSQMVINEFKLEFSENDRQKEKEKQKYKILNSLKDLSFIYKKQD